MENLNMEPGQYQEFVEKWIEMHVPNWRSCTSRMNIFNVKDFEEIVANWYWESKTLGADAFYRKILDSFMIQVTMEMCGILYIVQMSLKQQYPDNKKLHSYFSLDETPSVEKETDQNGNIEVSPHSHGSSNNGKKI